MKAAISIPDSLFEEAERLARRLRTSRSQLYALALADYLDRHDEDRITAAMDAVVDNLGPDTDEFLRETARQTLRRVEW